MELITLSGQIGHKYPSRLAIFFFWANWGERSVLKDELGDEAMRKMEHVLYSGVPMNTGVEQMIVAGSRSV